MQVRLHNRLARSFQAAALAACPSSLHYHPGHARLQPGAPKLMPVASRLLPQMVWELHASRAKSRITSRPSGRSASRVAFTIYDLRVQPVMSAGGSPRNAQYHDPQHRMKIAALHRISHAPPQLACTDAARRQLRIRAPHKQAVVRASPYQHRHLAVQHLATVVHVVKMML